MQGEILVNAIMELIIKGLASDFRNGRERQAMGSLPNDYRMSEALAKKIAIELGVSGLELAANGTLITSSPVKKVSTSTRTLNKTLENKVKPKSSAENVTITKAKTPGKFAEVRSEFIHIFIFILLIFINNVQIKTNLFRLNQGIWNQNHKSLHLSLKRR